MSTHDFSRLSAIYDRVAEGKGLSGVLNSNESDPITSKYSGKNESVLHLSIIRKLFTETSQSLATEQEGSSSDNPTSSRDGVSLPDEARVSKEKDLIVERHELCKKVLNDDSFLPIMIQYLCSTDQLVCFTASKALVAVFGNRELATDMDTAKLEAALSDIFAVVDYESFRDQYRCIYCLQFFTEVLKSLRKQELFEHPTLYYVMKTLKASWKKVIEFLSHITPSGPCLSFQYSSTVGESAPHYGQCLGEFLSLAVEVLRFIEIGLKKDYQFTQSMLCTVLSSLQYDIVGHLQPLTCAVNSCPSNLYLLKRLLNALLKVNYICHIITSSQGVSKSSASHPHSFKSSPSQPYNLEKSPASHPHKLPSPQPHDTISMLQSETPPTPITQSPSQIHHAITKVESTEDKATNSSHTSNLPVLHKYAYTSANEMHSLIVLLFRNSSLGVCFQFWLGKFMRMAGLVSDDVPTLPPSVEDELKCTVIRKACLLLLEHAALRLAENSPPLTVEVLLHLENLLALVVPWAKFYIPPTLKDTLGRLLQDEVESTGVDFLRLLVYSLLTEQDDCLVQALLASAAIHNSLYREYDSLNVDTPLLHLALGVCNVHTLFVKFLSGAGFDSTMLLDFIMSPETQFNHFLLSYLKIVIREKETSTTFNYDLQSACAELDIVDEYMNMDHSGSEGGGSEKEEEDELEPLHLASKASTVDPSLPSFPVSKLDSSLHVLKPSRGEEVGTEVDLTGPMHSVLSDSELVNASMCKETLSGRKRGLSDHETEGPAIKKANIEEVSEYDATLLDVSSSSSIHQHGYNIDTSGSQAYTVDSSVVAPPTVSCMPEGSFTRILESKVVSGKTFLGDVPNAEESLGDTSPDQSLEDPPPTQTFVRVMECLLRLGVTLTRMCDKELLSRRVNNVGLIITLTEKLRLLYPDISCLE